MPRMVDYQTKLSYILSYLSRSSREQENSQYAISDWMKDNGLTLAASRRHIHYRQSRAFSH